jgi:tRNA-Thr(GGU) m(6)t(6)A37 methyltransferase TsaA
MDIAFSPIGYVKSDVVQRKDIGWGDDTARIVIDPAFEKGLTGLSDFTHILVVYHLHMARFEASRHLARRPQGREDMPMVGIFAQRAKDRPNPIGVTAVKLMGVEGNVVMVAGLDAIDGTPILDIKPYYPAYDRKADAVVPEWVDKLMEHYF